MKIVYSVLAWISALWALLPAALRSLGQWIMFVAGACLIITIANLDAGGRRLIWALIAVAGFAFGYLCANVDTTEGSEGREAAEAFEQELAERIAGGRS